MRSTTAIAALGVLAQTALALQVHGVEVPDTPKGLVLTDVVEVESENADDKDKLVTIYHDLDPQVSKRDQDATEVLRLKKRCGSNRTECHQDVNSTTVKACEELFKWLRPGEALQTSPRSVCISFTPVIGPRAQCCVSWSKPAVSAYKDYLISAAQKAIRDCRYPARYDDFVSARILDVQLGTSCVTQCLSNRPDGCA